MIALKPIQRRYTLFEINDGKQVRYFTDYSEDVKGKSMGDKDVTYISTHIALCQYKIEVYSQEILIKGLFDKDLITNKDSLGFLKIGISFYYPENNTQQQIQFLTFYSTKIHLNKDEFYIYAHSNSKSLDNLVTKCYSDSCKANIGDGDCKVSLNEQASYIAKCIYKEAKSSNEILVQLAPKVSSASAAKFFDESQQILKNCVGGYAYINLDDNTFQAFYDRSAYDIHFYKNHRLEITGCKESTDNQYILQLDVYGLSHISYYLNGETLNEATLYILPRCDKTFKACEKFENQHNFQAEFDLEAPINNG